MREKHKMREKQEDEDTTVLIPGLPDDVALECLARVPLVWHRELRQVCRRWRDLAAGAGRGLLADTRARAGATEDLVFLVQALVASDGDDSKNSGGGAGDTPPPPAYGVAVYNATSGEWSRAAAAVPVFSQCAAAGEVLVVAGGWDPRSLEPVSGVRVYDPAAGEWRSGASMSAARSFFACAAAAEGGKVYVAGGHDANKNALKTAEVYDVATDTWSPLPDMSDERDECTGLVAAGNRFLAVSGYRTASQGAFEPDAEWYDVDTNEWNKLEQMWPPPPAADEEGDGGGNGGAACCLVVRGKIWSVEAGKRGVREWEGEGTGWRKVAPGAPGLKNAARATAVGGGDKIFVVGAVDGDVGGNGCGGHAAWVLDVKSRTWTRIDPPAGFSGFVFSLAAMRM